MCVCLRVRLSLCVGLRVVAIMLSLAVTQGFRGVDKLSQHRFGTRVVFLRVSFCVGNAVCVTLKFLAERIVVMVTAVE